MKNKRIKRINHQKVKFKIRCVYCGDYFIPKKGQAQTYCKRCLKVPYADRHVKFTNLKYGLA